VALSTRSSGVCVRRQTGAIGALVTGVDLSTPVDDETFELLRQALLDHLAICIRGQSAMTPEAQIAFGRRWGRLEPHPYVEPIEGYPEIMRVYDPHPITVTWHADFTFAVRPPAISLLLARVIPPVGGDTLFSNGYCVYEDLSPGMRHALDGLRALHVATERAAAAGLPPEDVRNVHPVVRTHPETGRRSLFVNGNYVLHFDGWTPEESAPLLTFLYERVGRPEYVYRHRWEPGDLLIWDNRCTQHRVVADTFGCERELHRVTVAGEVPSLKDL
jgi:taurine dioxygenase